MGQKEQPKINSDTDDITSSPSTYHPPATSSFVLLPLISAFLSLETPGTTTHYVKSTEVKPDCKVKDTELSVKRDKLTKK